MSLKNQSTHYKIEVDSIKKDLDEAWIEGLLLEDDKFEKAKAHVSFLYPELDISAM